MNEDELKKYEEYLLFQKQWKAERFSTLLRQKPPLPPWVSYPEIEPTDMFWRMGKGESLIDDLHIYLDHISESERSQYIEKYNEPPEWIGLYPKK